MPRNKELIREEERSEKETVSWYALTAKYLSLFQYDTARFYAERLFYDHASARNLHMLAKTYFLMGKVKQTYLVLQDARFCRVSLSSRGLSATTASLDKNPARNTAEQREERSFIKENQFLLATVCVQLNKLEEAEMLLFKKNRLLALDQITASLLRESVPGGAQGVMLLGKIARRQHRKDFAKHFYHLALELDPFLWSAIVELSELGEVVSLTDFLPDTHNPLTQHTPHTHTRSTSERARERERSDALLNSLQSSKSQASEAERTRFLSFSALDRLTGHADAHTLSTQRRTATTAAGSRSQSTPATQTAQSLSGLSLSMPFASPGAMPSPITFSMLASASSSSRALDRERDDAVESAQRAREREAPYTHSAPRDRDRDREINASLFGGPTPTPRRDALSLSLSTVHEEGTPLPHNALSHGASVSQALLESYEEDDEEERERERAKQPPLPRDRARERDRETPGPRRVSFGPTARLSFSSAHSLPRDRQDPFSANSVHGVEASHVDGHDTLSPIPALSRSALTPHTLSLSPLPSHTPHTMLSHMESDTPLTLCDEPPREDEENDVIAVIGCFARALQQLYGYYCSECIDTLQQLPEKHYVCGYVSQLIGKAYTEMNEYKCAIVAFKQMMRLEPFRVEGLETLSSALWHVKAEKELSALAQQAVEIDRLSPEVWCVVGNCFSAQREPTTALTFFQRAIQLSPYFTYAYTLSGHEHIQNEDLARATDVFRQALLINDLHYNAWYGLGAIYFRQERFELSEYHFEKAREINGRSSVLDCYLAMALSAQGTPSKIDAALEILSTAIARDPHNPQLSFQLAHILCGADRLEEALPALLEVVKRAPNEAPVHCLLGQVYQRMGNTHQAVIHLHIAADLDPKEAGNIKAIMETFEEPQPE